MQVEREMNFAWSVLRQGYPRNLDDISTSYIPLLTLSLSSDDEQTRPYLAHRIGKRQGMLQVAVRLRAGRSKSAV